MTYNENVYYKEDDYSTVYADGIVLRVEKDVCRLILYQESLEPTDQGKVIIDSTPVKRLTSEIRIPRKTFENLCSVGLEVWDILDRADKPTDEITDASVADAYWKLEKQIISRLIFDTNLGADGLAIRKARESIDDLIDRIENGRPLPTPTGEEQGEKQK